MAPSLLQRLWQGSAATQAVRASASEGTPRASRSGRRSSLFEQERRHLNGAIAGAGFMLRARCRFARRENPYAISAADVWVSYAVGTGWTPSVQNAAPEIKRSLHNWFKAWTDVADFDDRTDFYGLQAMLADEEWTVGEAFVRLIQTPGVGLQLQALQSEQLPYSNLGAQGYSLPPGHEIRLGVEFDVRGKRVAYHFYRQHPGDGTKSSVTPELLQRIPADEVVHFYRQRTPGQIRGYPQLAGALVPNFKLEEYEDALLERAAQSAKFFATIKRLSNEADTTSGETGVDAAEGGREYAMEAGVMYELDQDEELSFSTPPDPGANFDEFERRNIAKQCVAMGVPYTETSGDVRSANFSSTRVGRQPFRRRVLVWGHGTLVYQLCRRIWSAALKFDLLEGRVALPRGASRSFTSYLDLKWVAPAWEYVNPVDDAKADQILVAEGFKPRSQVQEEAGYNAEETDHQIAADRRREEDLDLNLGPRAPEAAATDPATQDTPNQTPANPETPTP